MAARRARLDAEEARWPLAARRAKVHIHLGFGSFVEYAERILDYAPRTTHERLRVAEALEGDCYDPELWPTLMRAARQEATPIACTPDNSRMFRDGRTPTASRSSSRRRFSSSWK